MGIMNAYEIAVGLAVILTVISQLFIRRAAQGSSGLLSIFGRYAILGYGLLLVVTLLMVYALQGIYLRTLIVWTSTTYILIPLSAGWFFKEKITLRGLAGSAFIIIGILVYLVP